MRIACPECAFIQRLGEQHAMESPRLIPRPRNPFPVRRISTFMALIATIGMGLGLFRVSPSA